MRWAALATFMETWYSHFLNCSVSEAVTVTVVLPAPVIFTSPVPDTSAAFGLDEA